jgi:predicted HAD superfamily Cof-like phosphohydrolase
MKDWFMNSIFDDLHEFHTKVLKLDKPRISLVSSEFVLERVRFIQEELTEFTDAALQGDLVGATDGLLDIIYVAGGTLWFMGVPSQECWNIIQKANMAKVRGITHRGNQIDARKPEGWQPPEPAIASAIQKAINQYNDAQDSGDPK